MLQVTLLESSETRFHFNPSKLMQNPPSNHQVMGTVDPTAMKSLRAEIQAPICPAPKSLLEMVRRAWGS